VTGESEFTLIINIGLCWASRSKTAGGYEGARTTEGRGRDVVINSWILRSSMSEVISARKLYGLKNKER
jgi:hypothetical protein